MNKVNSTLSAAAYRWEGQLKYIDYPSKAKTLLHLSYYQNQVHHQEHCSLR